MLKDNCEHDFRGFDYSKLLERWIKYCPKCGLINDEPRPIDERLQRAIAIRIKNGDIAEKGNKE